MNGNNEELSRRDSAKLFFELFKHLTTLSTGTIVLLGIFLEKIFTTPIWMPLVIITFVGLIVGLISALGAMTYFAVHVRGDLSEKSKDTGTWFVIVSLGGFLVGIFSLTIFVVKNFMT